MIWQALIDAAALDEADLVVRLLADGAEKAGPFKLELHALSAFRYDEGRELTCEETHQGLKLNRKVGYNDVKTA